MHTDGPSRDRLLLRRRTNYASHTLGAVGGAYQDAPRRCVASSPRAGRPVWRRRTA